MRFELFLGLRYLKSKRRNFFISFITVISVAGVMVGVTALITVLAVMTGFDEELRDKVLGNRSHLTVERLGGPFEDYERIVDQIEEHPEVAAAAPVITTEALLIAEDRERTGAIIVGIDPERQSGVTEFGENLSGKLRKRGIVLGSGVRNMLQTGIGSTVRLTTGRVFSHLIGYSADMRSFEVTGVYHSGMYEFDSSSVFLLLEDAQKLTGLKDAVSAIQVKLIDPFRAQEVGQEIINSLGRGYWGQTWIDQNRTFFYALKQEKIVMFVILTLVVVVAAFNIVSTLIMIVMEKRRDIGVLRSVGAPTRSIMGVFIFEGLTVGVVGTLLGLAGGITLAKSLNNIKEVIAEKTGLDLFSPEVYIFDKIPVSIQTGDVITVTVSAVLICLLATIYPAWQAARLNPAECLRYE
jgi:lipoprotein-releasing system permease protein